MVDFQVEAVEPVYEALHSLFSAVAAGNFPGSGCSVCLGLGVRSALGRASN